MARIIGIDYGLKRTGLAWTDPLQIIATGLDTVETPRLQDRLKEIIQKEPVEAIVIGMPTKLDGSPTDTTAGVLKLEQQLKSLYPQLKIALWDEQFSSKKAMQAMIQGGMSKKGRRDKAMIDKVSATIILQEYLAQHAL